MTNVTKKLLYVSAFVFALLAITGCTSNVQAQPINTNVSASQSTTNSTNQTENNGNSVAIPSCH